MSIMGTRVVRVEDPAFLTRGARYTDDLDLVGALHLTLVRSPLAHARIEAIDVGEARSAPGVVGVFTGADVDLEPALLFGGANEAMVRAFLATDVVRFVGEPVAAVLTEERLPGAGRRRPGRGRLRPAAGRRRPQGRRHRRGAALPRGGHQHRPTASTTSKDLDPNLFDGCEVVVTRELVNQRLAASPLETRAAAAEWGDDGRAHPLVLHAERAGHPRRGGRAGSASTPSRCA